MAPFIQDESDSKSSAQATTSSVSSPDASSDSDSPEPVDLSLWAIGNTVLHELRSEDEQMDQTWREVHGTEGTWGDRAIAHRIRTAVGLAQQMTPTRSNAPSLDDTDESRTRADHDAHAAPNFDEVADAWAEFHGINGPRNGRLDSQLADAAEEAAYTSLGASGVGSAMVPDQEQISGRQVDGGSDLRDAPGA